MNIEGLLVADTSSPTTMNSVAPTPASPIPHITPRDLVALPDLTNPSASGMDSLAMVAAAAPYASSSLPTSDSAVVPAPPPANKTPTQQPSPRHFGALSPAPAPSPIGASPPSTTPSTPTAVTAFCASPALRNTVWSESSGSTRMSAELAAADMHVLAMGGSGPHVCSFCGSGFAQKLRLLHHLYSVHNCREHKGKKIIPCTLCDSAFLRNTDLKKHISCVHEKRRPHACTARGCDSRFFFAKDLKKHISTVHERNKPFGCPKCGQRFGKREHMTSHVRRVHEKLKPFHCTVCKVPLASKYNLQGHLRTFSHKQRVASLAASGVVFDSPMVRMTARPGTVGSTLGSTLGTIALSRANK